MDRDKQTPADQNDQDRNKANSRDQDIHDSQRDLDRLKGDEGTLDLPDVRDIPGQEHIHVPPMGELGDTTPSSDDEEGTDVLGE